MVFGGKASGRRAIIRRFNWACVDLVDAFIRSDRLLGSSCLEKRAGERRSMAMLALSFVSAISTPQRQQQQARLKKIKGQKATVLFLTNPLRVFIWSYHYRETIVPTHCLHEA
jgi:hypothetical protein